MGGICDTYGDMRTAYKIVVKYTVKRQLEKPGRRWGLNIKMDI